MRRIVNFLFIITIIATGIIGIISVDSYYVDIKLNSKTIVNFDFRNAEEEVTMEKFLEELVDFSEEFDVNISKYAYINGTTINIYSTNRFQEWKVPVKRDNYTYITNKTNYFNKDEVRFLFPFSRYHLRVYDISMVNNVGLGTELYLNSEDSIIIDCFKQEFNKYGIDEILSGQADIKGIVDEFFITGILCLFLSVFLCSIACIIAEYKYIVIMHIWGYSDGKVCCFLLKRKLILCLKTFILSMVILIIIGFTITGTDCIVNYFMVLFVTVMVVLGILSTFLFGEVKILRKIGNQNFNGKRKLNGMLPGVVLALKMMVLVLFLITIVKSFEFAMTLDNENTALASWERTKNVYKIEYSLLDDSLEELMSDYGKDRALNDRLQRFYDMLSKKRECFLIKADNFTRVVLTNGVTIYENEFYGDKFYDFPLGEWITIDENYLKVNPIKTCDGALIKDKINQDPNVMNILIPEKYQEFESSIVEKALDGFYFKKVTVDNIYNEEMNLPVNQTTKEQLSINVIYVENNQTYYTYQMNKGDMNNLITDPLVYIYNGNVDSSDMGSMINSCVFYISESEGQAFLELQDVIKEAGAPDITGVKSVYDEGGAKINELRVRIERHSIYAIVFLMFFIIIFIMYSWLTYKMNVYNSAIKKVMGYSEIHIYKGNIMMNILLMSGTIIAVCLKYNEQSLILITGTVIILLDNIFFCILTGSMSEKEIKNVIRERKL